MPDRSLSTGLLAAAGVLVIWSGFIVFSRAGVLAGLTPYDITAMRFLVAGLLTLPFTLSWWPRHLPVGAQVLLALAGPGAIYSVMMFTGLQRSSAAYGGVFSNGALPLFTMLLAFAVAGTRPGRGEWMGSLIIVTGGILVAWRGLGVGGTDVFTGIALFLGAAVIISIYIYGIRHWNVTPRQALAIVNIPNMVIFLPVWVLFLPSTMAETSWEVVVAQTLFQGLGPGFLAIVIFAMMAYHLGPTPTAAVSAAVPASATLLAIPVLGEIPTQLEWIGIVVVTAGLMVLTLRR